MNRRQFITRSAATSAGLLFGINSCSNDKQDADAQKRLAAGKNKLAGLTLEELREQHRYYLFDDYLPFLEKYVIDHKYGGFMCNTDRDGTNITQKKTTWYEGRGIWVFSFLYNKIAREQRYLEIARKSVQFILKNEPKGDTLFPEEYTRQGRPVGGPSKGIYGDLFVANGLAGYSKAIGDDSYWHKAKEIVLKCLRIYDSPDYAFHADYGPQVPPFKGERVLGHWMIILRLITQMLEFKSDPELEKVADRCVDALMNKHYNPEFKLMNEVLNHDMTMPAGGFSQFVATGHAIESLWMVMAEALRRKDQSLFELAMERFKFHLKVAWDDVYGGIFHYLNHVDNYTWQTTKALWAQEEVLIGLMLIIEQTGAQWAKDWYARMWNYVTEKFPLEQYGFPIWILYADRKVTFERHYDRVGNFHHPRHLMVNLLRLGRMIERGK